MKVYAISFLAAFIAAYCFSCSNESVKKMSDSELLNLPRERATGVSNSGGWSTSGNLTIGGTNRVTLQAVFPISGNYTLEFAVTDAPNPNGGSRIQQTEALITWSVEGNSVTRRVTIGNGVTVSGAAQGVRVEMFDVSDSSVNGDAYTVAMQVVPGTRPTTNRPPTYELISEALNLAGGASVDYAIESDIGATAVYTSVYGANGGAAIVLPNNSVTVSCLSDSGALLRIADPNVFEWVPLPPGTKTLRITNHMAAGNVVTYRPSLGIDG